ncbi:hypothetical protein RUM43_002008 [Polyplax serrata]|uniref:Uncharacterized protein n=1 Tax=Polyplax serrata TaxID=468196 RepID=A0AAN8PFE5_POLSC
MPGSSIILELPRKKRQPAKQTEGSVHGQTLINLVKIRDRFKETKGLTAVHTRNNQNVLQRPPESYPEDLACAF